jgi:chemotaxis protein histidine kinase CheA
VKGENNQEAVMKNANKVISLFLSVTGLSRIRKSSMKSGRRIMSLALLSMVALAPAIPSHAQRRTATYPTPTYVPPAPQYRPAPQTQSRPAPQPQPRPAQPQYNPPAQSAPQHRTESTQQRPPQTAPSTQESTREQVHQQQDQARQKELQKQQQKQLKDQTRQKKDQEKQQQQQKKEQEKQQEKQKKDQARQQKEQQKEIEKQQKEQARQQKESQKQEKSKKGASSAHSASGKNSVPQSLTPSAAKGPTSSSMSGKVLTSSQSQATIQRLNSARSNMSGINHRPLPSGDVTLHSNGGMTVKAEGGRQYGVRYNGTIASYGDRGRAISFDKSGKISSIHTANLDIYRGTQGQRTIISRRADGSKVVSTGRHSGYVERNVVVNNKTYIQRTTVVNQHVYTNTFVANSHGSVVLAGFVPPAFFAPRFYGWAYYPWAAPISFGWGWFGAPWYAGPNPYFVASPMYPSAAFWLTDYMIGDTLATGYELDNDAATMDHDGGAAYTADADMPADDNSEASSGQQATIHANVTTPITPEIKSQIAEEVKGEIVNDNVEASNPSQSSFDVLPSVLSNPNHVFVVSTDLDLTTTDQQLCALQAGDMLQLLSPAASDASFVQLRVASSRRMDCPAGILVTVSLPDLQDMQNNFQARVEAGLGMLRNDQGRGGLPAAPPDTVADSPRPAVEGLAPVSAAESSAVLDQLRQEADQTESQAVSSAF